MLGVLFSVNIGLTSCVDRDSEEPKEELTPQALYQTSWRGTGSWEEPVNNAFAKALAGLNLKDKG